jgi:hypothetical protein
VAGLQKDINATDQQFSTAVSIFYATYVTFETLLAILLKELTPRVLLVSILRGLVFDYHFHWLHPKRRRTAHNLPYSGCM